MRRPRAPRASQGSADPPEHLRERITPTEYARGPHDEADVPKRSE